MNFAFSSLPVFFNLRCNISFSLENSRMLSFLSYFLYLFYLYISPMLHIPFFLLIYSTITKPPSFPALRFICCSISNFILTISPPSLSAHSSSSLLSFLLHISPPLALPCFTTAFVPFSRCLFPSNCRHYLCSFLTVSPLPPVPHCLCTFPFLSLHFRQPPLPVYLSLCGSPPSPSPLPVYLSLCVVHFLPSPLPVYLSLCVVHFLPSPLPVYLSICGSPPSVPTACEPFPPCFFAPASLHCLCWSL